MLAGVEPDCRYAMQGTCRLQASQSQHLAEPSTMKVACDHSPAEIDRFSIAVDGMSATSDQPAVAFDYLVFPSDGILSQKLFKDRKSVV